MSSQPTQNAVKRPPLFSLIVPTVGRTTELDTLLTSLTNQTIQDFEVLIIDQNRNDDVVAVIRNFLNKFCVRHIRQAARGLSKAKNTGMRYAKGQFITFPDDDCSYNSHILERVLAIFKTNSRVDGVMGRCGDEITQKSAWRLSNKKQCIKRYTIFRTLNESAIFLRSSSVRGTYFDEDMGVGSSTPWWSDEGPDLILRLINKGSSFLYCPEILIYHPNPVKDYDEKAILRSYRYGNGRGRFLKKHKYPWWFVGYSWGLYILGIGLGIFQCNAGKIKYYWSGLKGRIKGYITS